MRDCGQRRRQGGSSTYGCRAPEDHTRPPGAGRADDNVVLTYGGAALTEETAQSLKASGVELQCTYGQTELAGMVLLGCIVVLVLRSPRAHNCLGGKKPNNITEARIPGQLHRPTSSELTTAGATGALASPGTSTLDSL